jgi:hypothetical protein
MALNLNSNAYSGTGQTSLSFFLQHHQFILNLKISFTSASSLRILKIFNRFLRIWQEFFLKIFSIGDFT